jgi:poly-gamma-glutamate capsule biosynthesis protein CapA/YwtB (metallophosphatase superfamily)
MEGMTTVRAVTGRSAHGLRSVAGVSLMLALATCGVASTGTSGVGTRGTLVIHGTGDVSLDPRQIPSFRTRGYDWAWSGLGGMFRRDDLTMVNLECPATHVVDPEPKAFAFRCDPQALPAARRAGIDVANQANNHSYDHGPTGLVDSLHRIRAAGLVAVGAGTDRPDALRAASFRIHGWRVAVLGIDEVLDPLDQVAGPNKPGTAAGHDFPLALRAVREATASSDFVVVMIHWGVELEARPRGYQVDQAHRLIDAGADVIFGSHPHVLQPLETYRDRPIFYSLGNFVWPRLASALSATAVAEVVVTPDGTVRGRLIPVEIVSDGHPVLASGPEQSVHTGDSVSASWSRATRADRRRRERSR